MASTVGTATQPFGVMHGRMRKSFYTAGRFWYFYSDGTNAGWETSTDGTTWAGSFTSIGACDRGHFFSIWFDGTYVHYARNDRTVGYDLYYRRGVPESDGSITWSAAEQLVQDGTATNTYETPTIAVDTNGYAWIGVYFDKQDGDDLPVIIKNANNDGTWALDFEYTLNATDEPGWAVTPVPLTDGKVYVIYARNAVTLGRLYDSGWGSEENDVTDNAIERSYVYSAVTEGDDVHFVYTTDGNVIRYNKRTFGVGWAADVQVQTGATVPTTPSLSIDAATGDLYCFWTKISTDHVYYKKYSSGSWGGLVDWIDESADDIQYDYLISSFYTSYNGQLGVAYQTELGSPYKVRFNFLSLPVSGSADLKAEFVVRQDATKDLFAEAVIRQPGTAELYAKFEVTQPGTGDLYAEFVIRQPGTQDLFSELIVRQAATQNLFSEFTLIRSATKDLFAKFLVRQEATQDLFAQFVTRFTATKELFAYFEVCHCEDLFAYFEVTHSADLFSEFTVRQTDTVDLFAELVVRQETSVDLFAEFTVLAGIADLFAKLMVSQDLDEELFAELIIRHSTYSRRKIFCKFVIRHTPIALDLLAVFKVSQATVIKELYAKLFVNQYNLSSDLYNRFYVRPDRLTVDDDALNIISRSRGTVKAGPGVMSPIRKRGRRTKNWLR